jgi:GAF domain-containing protein
MKPNAPDRLKENNALEHLKGLHDLIERMNSVYELQELLEFVVDKALNLTGGRRGLLLLSNDQERELRDIAIVRGAAPDHERLEQALEAASSTVIKDVLSQGEPRLVMDLPTDQRYEGIASRSTIKLKHIRSVLAVPLKVGQELVGLVYIDHPQKAIFDQSDLYFLSAFANQAAIAIHRAREHQRRIEELTRLNELSRSVVQVLDLDQVLTNIVNAATEMLNVETGSVLLLEESGAELSFATSVSNGKAVKIPTRLRKDQGLAGWVISTGQPVCLNDLSNDPRWFGEVEADFNTQSLLCVPLQLKGRALGVLEVLNTKKRDGFCDEDLTLLSAFAASATIAIENARLFNEARQVRQLRALNELALTLGRTFDLDAILKICLEQSLALVGADAGVIIFLDNPLTAGPLPVQFSQNLTQKPVLAEQHMTILRELVLALNGSGDELLILDESQIKLQPEGQALIELGLKALAVAPIKVGCGVKGGLVVMNMKPHTYGQEAISLLTGITHIVGLAIQNATHYLEAQDRAHQLVRLNEIGLALTRGVSGLDLPFVLQVVIDGVNATLRTERASIFLIDEESQELVLSYTNEGHVEIRLPAPWQGSIAGWVARHNQPRILNDPSNDPDYMSDIADRVGYQIHSLLCTPIVVEGKVIGVIEALNKKDGHPFHERDQEELIEFAKWAAVTIHNARLFEQRLFAYQRLANEQRRRHAAEARSAMTAIILDMAHTMNNIIGAIRFWTLDLQDEPLTSSNSVFSEGLAEILRNAEEAIDLISKARHPFEKMDLAPTDVRDCLARAIQSCPWPSSISRREIQARELPAVKANERHLESVFQNLLLNALQALTPHGGEICICTSYTLSGWVEIRIIDNGPGIPAELQDRLFDAKESSKEEGLGLGLWLVETFIHQFGGRIEFTSSAAEGTTFIINLQPWPVER